MPTNLSYPLLSQPLVDPRGYLARPWQQFFEALAIRVGADRAMTNLELENDLAANETTAAASAAANAAAITAEMLLSAFASSPQRPAALAVEGLFTAPLHRHGTDIERLFDDRGAQWLSAGLAVRKNSGTVVGTRRQLNTIEGQAITLTVADDGSEIDLTIAVVGGASQAYTESNVTTTRTFDADTVTLPVLADVVGTMIADLRTRALVA